MIQARQLEAVVASHFKALNTEINRLNQIGKTTAGLDNIAALQGSRLFTNQELRQVLALDQAYMAAEDDLTKELECEDTYRAFITETYSDRPTLQGEWLSVLMIPGATTALGCAESYQAA